MSEDVGWPDYNAGVDLMLGAHKEMVEKKEHEERCQISADASVSLFDAKELASLLAVALDRLATAEVKT